MLWLLCHFTTSGACLYSAINIYSPGCILCDWQDKDKHWAMKDFFWFGALSGDALSHHRCCNKLVWIYKTWIHNLGCHRPSVIVKTDEKWRAGLVCSIFIHEYQVNQNFLYFLFMWMVFSPIGLMVEFLQVRAVRSIARRSFLYQKNT